MSDQPALFASAEIPLWTTDEHAPAVLPAVRWKYSPHPLEVREQIRATALHHMHKRTAGEYSFAMHDAVRMLDLLCLEATEGQVVRIASGAVEPGDVVLVGSHPWRPLSHDSRWRPEMVRWQHDGVVMTKPGTLLDCRGPKGTGTVVVDLAKRLT